MSKKNTLTLSLTKAKNTALVLSRNEFDKEHKSLSSLFNYVVKASKKDADKFNELIDLKNSTDSERKILLFTLNNGLFETFRKSNEFYKSVALKPSTSLERHLLMIRRYIKSLKSDVVKFDVDSFTSQFISYVDELDAKRQAKQVQTEPISEPVTMEEIVNDSN